MNPLTRQLIAAAEAIEAMDPNRASPIDLRAMACIQQAGNDECVRLGLEPGVWWMEKRKDAQAVRVRRAAFRAAVKAGYTYSTIARTMGLHHASVMRLAKTEKAMAVGE